MSNYPRRWAMIALVALFIASSFLSHATTAFAMTGDTTTRVSVTASGGEAEWGTWNISEPPSISGDGLAVAFTSKSTNIVSGDTNGKADIFVYDAHSTPTVVRVTNMTTSLSSYYPVAKPVLSHDGRYVAFQGDGLLNGSSTNPPVMQVYLYDRDSDNDGTLDESGATTLNYASIDTGSARGTSSSYAPSISADGRWVVFESEAALASGDSDNEDIYLYDRENTTTTLISKNNSGTKGNGESLTPFISPNGRYIAYESTATNLVSSDTNGKYDIFVYDRDTDHDGILDESGATSTVLASRANGATGDIGDNHSRASTVSDNGKVAFVSSSTNLATSCSSPSPSCVFVRDVVNNTTSSLSNYSVSTGRPFISKFGNFVAFQTSAAIAADDTNSKLDVYRYNLAMGTIIRASVSSSDSQGSDHSQDPTVSDDGLKVAYRSDASDLIGSGNDTNSAQDVFVSYKQWDAPSWWNGDTCDSTHYNANNGSTPDAYALSSTGWNGIIPCGPRPGIDGTDVSLTGTPLAGDLEWECPELAKRYLYIAYGLPRIQGNGYQVAINYYNTYSNTLALDHITIDQSTPHSVSPHLFPQPGSVISYYTNHVAIVTAVNITDATNGNATITVMEQNIAANGFSTDTMSGWVYSAHSGLTGRDWITPK